DARRRTGIYTTDAHCRLPCGTLCASARVSARAHAEVTMNNKIWAPLGGWVGAVGLAVALAFAVPHTTLILGKVPEVAVRSLDQRQLLLPQELPAGRTLAIVAFKRSQREEVQSWIDGLELQKENAFALLRMTGFDL